MANGHRTLRGTTCGALTAFIVGCPAHKAHQPAAVTPRVTLVDTLLAREHELAQRLNDPNADRDFEEARKTLEKVLARAEEAIGRLPARMDGRAVFNAIERTLIDENFVLCITRELLHDMLVGHAISDCTTTLRPYTTPARDEHYRLITKGDASPSDLHFFDCDLGSFLFIAVGERMGLPIGLVEIPRHNFVRWTNSDGTHINWDVNEATDFSDNEYLGLGPRAPKNRCTRCGTPEARANEQFVVMSSAAVEGYHHALLGLAAEHHKMVPLAETYYLDAIRLRPTDSVANNNLAWIWSTDPHFESAKVGERAVAHAKVALRFEPDDRNVLDTLSCALAAAGRFDEAIKIEKELESRNQRWRICRYARKLDCRKQSLLADGGIGIGTDECATTTK